MRRRAFIEGIAALGVAWPLAARAQQSAMPVIGYLNGASAAQFPQLLDGFHKGLSETGYSEGRNVAFEYRYADGRTPTIRAAKAATSSIPIVFVIGGDPVTFGIVASFNRPGGNITGMTLSGSETVAKRLGLMLELVPTAAVIAVLANPKNPISESQLTELRACPQTRSPTSSVKCQHRERLRSSFHSH
jgi:putative ABC transport system substrate-binding protein